MLRTKKTALAAEELARSIVARDDPVQGIYENVRCEALENSEPASWPWSAFADMECQLLPAQPDFPFILCAQVFPVRPGAGRTFIARNFLSL